MNGLLAQGSELFVMHADGLLEVVDISSAVPIVLGSLNIGANAGKMAFGDGVLYVGEGIDLGHGGYSTIDVSNPAAPALIINGQTGFFQAGLAGGSLASTGSGSAASVQDLNVITGPGQVVTQHLLDLLRGFKQRGIASIIISHKLNEVMAISQARLNVQSAYIPKFRAILSDIKVTRFFQIDNKLRALVQCQIAQIVPLAQPTGAAASGGNM